MELGEGELLIPSALPTEKPPMPCTVFPDILVCSPECIELLLCNPRVRCAVSSLCRGSCLLSDTPTLSPSSPVGFGLASCPGFSPTGPLSSWQGKAVVSVKKVCVCVRMCVSNGGVFLRQSAVILGGLQ